MMTATTLTADQVALNEYIAAQNEAVITAAGEGATTFIFAWAAEELAQYGVSNIAQFKAWQEELNALEDEKEARKNSYGW